jgi:hypothetical protein
MGLLDSEGMKPEPNGLQGYTPDTPFSEEAQALYLVEEIDITTEEAVEYIFDKLLNDHGIIADRTELTGIVHYAFNYLGEKGLFETIDEDCDGKWDEEGV